MANHDAKGYYFSLAGSAETRTVETIKFFLALKDAGIPVYIHDAVELVARLKGEERIGIVPESVIPVYCSLWFPNERIIDYMNLPYENREANLYILNNVEQGQNNVLAKCLTAY